MVRERTSLSRLALKSCRRMLHSMTRVDWQLQQHSDKPRGFGHWRGYSKCRKCGMLLGLNTLPLPNEIDIGGEAVALICPDQYLFERHANVYH